MSASPGRPPSVATGRRVGEACGRLLIPVTLVWIVVEGVMAYAQVGPWAVR